MKPDRNKINIEMAKKKWNVPQLARAYGVSGSRMNVILNSQNLTSACVGRLAETLGVDVETILEDV